MPSLQPTPNAQLPRRAALGGLFALSVLSACGGPKDGRGGRASSPESAELASAAAFADAVTALERGHNAEVGVFALETGSGKTLEHRADQRFMMCSTWKGVAVGLALHRSQDDPGFLGESASVPADPGPIAEDSPFARERLGQSATYAELCRAAVQVSDNLAANLLLDRLGGPPAVTAYLRSLGDRTTRLDRPEEEMNYGRAEDLLDTTTPRAIATTYQTLVLGSALAPQGRRQLADWMLGTTTGLGRIRAGLPPDWKTADKTGTAGRGQGEAHDVAVVWPAGGRAPLVLAVLTRTLPPGMAEDQLLADVAGAARAALAP